MIARDELKINPRKVCLLSEGGIGGVLIGRSSSRWSRDNPDLSQLDFRVRRFITHPITSVVKSRKIDLPAVRRERRVGGSTFKGVEAALLNRPAHRCRAR